MPPDVLVDSVRHAVVAHARAARAHVHRLVLVSPVVVRILAPVARAIVSVQHHGVGVHARPPVLAAVGHHRSTPSDLAPDLIVGDDLVTASQILGEVHSIEHDPAAEPPLTLGVGVEALGVLAGDAHLAVGHGVGGEQAARLTDRVRPPAQGVVVPRRVVLAVEVVDLEPQRPGRAVVDVGHGHDLARVVVVAAAGLELVTLLDVVQQLSGLGVHEPQQGVVRGHDDDLVGVDPLAVVLLRPAHHVRGHVDLRVQPLDRDLDGLLGGELDVLLGDADVEGALVRQLPAAELVVDLLQGAVALAAVASAGEHEDHERAVDHAAHDVLRFDVALPHDVTMLWMFSHTRRRWVVLPSSSMCV